MTRKCHEAVPVKEPPRSMSTYYLAFDSFEDSNVVT